jgi:arylsulfatase A-like enzyme
LRDLVGELRTRGLLDDTLLVVVSDHGENLGEHGGLLNHVLSFHQTLLHVPLLVRRPGRFAAGLRYQPPVSTLSVFATVLDETGAKVPANQQPALGPLPRDLTQAPPLEVFSEYELPVFAMAAIVDDVPGFNVAPLAVRQHAVRQGPWKLVRMKPGETMLYDLANDPAEASPLAADSNPEGQKLASDLDEWEATLPDVAARGSTSHNLDFATLKALEGLGYVR